MVTDTSEATKTDSKKRVLDKLALKHVVLGVIDAAGS